MAYSTFRPTFGHETGTGNDGGKGGKLRTRERKLRAVGNFLFPPFFGMPTTRTKLFVNRSLFAVLETLGLFCFCFFWLKMSYFTVH